jgi:hypothetical protein
MWISRVESGEALKRGQFREASIVDAAAAAEDLSHSTQ